MEGENNDLHSFVFIQYTKEDVILTDKWREPKQQTEGSVGYDVYANIAESVTIPPLSSSVISSGFRVNLPTDYYIQIASRSGLAFKHSVTAFHGIIDSDYTGVIQCLMFNNGCCEYTVKPGDRICQFIVSKYERSILCYTSSFMKLEEGHEGFGSTGK